VKKSALSKKKPGQRTKRIFGRKQSFVEELLPSGNGNHKESTAMKVRPLHDRILLKRIEEKESIKGGIVIPDTAKEKPQEGLVVAVGNGKILENGTKLTLAVKEGDRVLFGKYSGTEIKVDGEEYLIVREDDVLGILAESAKSKASK
jgi:chaperonin GroES